MEQSQGETQGGNSNPQGEIPPMGNSNPQGEIPPRGKNPPIVDRRYPEKTPQWVRRAWRLGMALGVLLLLPVLAVLLASILAVLLLVGGIVGAPLLAISTATYQEKAVIWQKTNGEKHHLADQ